jgi:hypothetical protein
MYNSFKYDNFYFTVTEAKGSRQRQRYEEWEMVAMKTVEGCEKTHSWIYQNAVARTQGLDSNARRTCSKLGVSIATPARPKYFFFQNIFFFINHF